MRVEQIEAALAALDEQIDALSSEITLKRRERSVLARKLGGLRSGERRRAEAEGRRRLIEARLKEHADQLYYPGGLIKSTAEEFGLSTRHVGRIYADVKRRT